VSGRTFPQTAPSHLYRKSSALSHKKAILAAVLATLAASAFAELTYLAKSSDGEDTYYIDYETIRKDGAYVRVGKLLIENSGIKAAQCPSARGVEFPQISRQIMTSRKLKRRKANAVQLGFVHVDHHP
jgi:hypothetical protein